MTQGSVRPRTRKFQAEEDEGQAHGVEIPQFYGARFSLPASGILDAIRTGAGLLHRAVDSSGLYPIPLRQCSHRDSQKLLSHKVQSSGADCDELSGGADLGRCHSGGEQPFWQGTEHRVDNLPLMDILAANVLWVCTVAQLHDSALVQPASHFYRQGGKDQTVEAYCPAPTWAAGSRHDTLLCCQRIGWKQVSPWLSPSVAVSLAVQFAQM